MVSDAMPVAAPVAAQWGSEAGQPTPPPAILSQVTTNADGEVAWNVPAGSPTPPPAWLDQVTAAPPVAEPTPAVQWASEAGQPTPPPALLNQVTTNDEGEVVWDLPAGSPTPPPELLDQVVASTPDFAQGADTTNDRPVEVADFYGEEEPSFAQGGETTTSTADTSIEGPNFAQGGDTTTSTATTTDTEGPNFAQGGETTTGNDLAVEIFEPAPQPATQPQDGPNFAQGGDTVPAPAPGPATPQVTTQQVSPGTGGYPQYAPNAPVGGEYSGGYPQYAPNAPPPQYPPNYGGYGMYPQMPMYPQFPQYAPMAPTQPVAPAATTPVATGGGGNQVVMHHNMAFIGDCLKEACIADENEEYFKGHSNEDDAIYEIFYTNPVKCCGVVMEVGAGDGLDGSVSHFFEKGLNWKSILIEANPDKFKELKKNRPDATAINAGFCESGSMKYDGEFHPEEPDEIISEAISTQPFSEDASEDVMCLSMNPLIKQNLKVTHIDVIIIHVEGDPLAVIRKMDWTVRADIWIIINHEKEGPFATPELEEKNDVTKERFNVVKDVLERNEYVEAEWDIKRWCDEDNMGHCENNTVFLRKNFNPLYLQRSLKGKRQLRGNNK